MHEGLVRSARIVESRPSDVELQGGSSIAVAAVSKDRLNDELLLIVLSYSQRIGADGIVDERAKVVCKSNPSYLLLGMVRDVWVRVCYRDQQVVCVNNTYE